MRAIQFLVIFSLIFNSPFAIAAETSGGAKQSASGSRKPSSSEQSSDVKLQKGSCPTPLKEWVKDDYTDKSTLIVFKFNSEAKTCNSSVTAYQDYMSGKGVQTQFQTPDALSAELSKQFSTTISPNMARTLNGCNSAEGITPEQAKVVQTRFYAAATRIENFNKSAVDEIAFIDSITEGSPVLDGIECTPLLPELKKNCENLRAEGGKCKADTAKRLDEQVDKTVAALEKIEALKEAENKCKQSAFVKCAGATKDCPMRGGYTFTSQKVAAKKCENITKAIEVIKDEVPWVRGEIFDKIAREKAKPRNSVRKYLGREKIKEGLKEQLKANRTALATAYKDNLQNFRCLIYDTDDKGEKCDFEKVRTELAKLDAPTIPQLSDKRANMEFKTYFDAESCLLDRHEDRAGTKNVVDNAAVDAGLTVLTAGLGSIAVGAKVIGGLSKTAIATRRGAFAGSLALDGYFAQGSSKQAYQSCTEKSTAILDNLSVQQKQKNMVCDNAQSQVSVAREINSSCLVDTLLAGADLLPFVGGAAPLLARAAKNTDVPSASALTPTVPTAKSEVAAVGRTTPTPKAEETAGAKPESKPKEQKPADTPQSAGQDPAPTPEVAVKPSDKPAEQLMPTVATTASGKPETNRALTTEEQGQFEFFTQAAQPKPKTNGAGPDATHTAKTDSSHVADTGGVGKAAGDILDSYQQHLQAGTRVAMPDPTGSGNKIDARVVGMAGTPQKPQVELAYQKTDGSMASRNVEMRDFLESNPQVRERLDASLYQFMSGGRNMQADRATAAARPLVVQPTQTVASLNRQPAAALEIRSNNNNSTAMAAAAAPSAPRAEPRRVAAVVNQRAQTGPINSGGSLGGGSAPSIEMPRSSGSSGGGGRSPASVVSTDSTTSVEDELVAALSGKSNTGTAAPALPQTKAQPVSIFNGSGSSANTGSSAKVKAFEDSGVVDTTTNARFVEGEKIRVANFEGGKDAEFTVVKKLDNGLLRVSDGNGKEFDLLRSEVKGAERLSLNGAPDLLLNAKPAATPAKIGNNLPPGELVHKAAKVDEVKIPDDIKLKEEFVRPGDKITVKNFEAGGDLKASVVRKNTDGTVRVKDENGKEFDLVKSEVKGAEFSRELPDEVRKNLEIADEADRVKAAQNYVNRSLTPAQEQAVLKSHKVAQDKGIYTLSKTDLKQKTKVLRDAGFTDDEADLLLRKGVTGGTGLDNVRIVSEQAPTPKFEIVKGKQIQVPMGNTGRTNPGAVMSGPDKYGYYEVEFYQKGAGIGRTRKTAKELTETNVQRPPKVENPVINVPVVGKDISYPGKVISGPDAKGQYEVEIYPPGKPVTVVRMNELDLKRANTPLALRQAKIRDARRASFEKKSSAELEQILSDSLRQAEGRGVRDRYDVSYGSSGKPDKTLKTKKIDTDGQKALEELAKRQNKDVNVLYEETKLARKSVAQPQKTKSSVSTMSAGDIYNSPQAGGARNELDFLAEQDGLKGSKFNEKQFDNMARELGINDANRAAAMDYGAVASRKETRDLFDRLFPGQKPFDQDLLRQTMSYNPRGGYIGAREFANAEAFVEAVKKADVSQLTLSERRLLNKYTDRAPLYARQANPDVGLLPRQSIEVDAAAAVVPPSASRKMASVDEPAISALPTARSQVEDAAKTAGEARSRLDYLAEQDALKGSRLNPRQRESVARELGIYDENKTAALDYASVGTKKEVNALFDKIFPGKKDFDVELLRQSMSYNPRGGYVGAREFSNAEKFVAAVRKADVDGSTLSLSERRLLNRFTDRAPLYARQVTPETASIPRQSLEAVVPPRITNDKVSGFATRGDEIVAQVTLKPEMARAGDQVQLKNFEGGSDLNAYFVRKNKDGTVRVKDSRGKEFNLSAQATGEANYYRGLTAELKVNGDLDAASRVKAAEAYVKRPLTPVQKDAVTAAHAVGGQERGYFDYTAKELREKTEILRKSGFTTAEASLLLRKGIAGNNPKDLAKVIKVEPSDVRIGDRVTIDQFNGTGELRGEIVGPAKNGGMILREANGTETIIYKTDLDDVTNTRITRDPNRRTIASADEKLTLDKAPIVSVNTSKKAVPVEASEARVGDRVVISEFNGAGELDGFIVGSSKNGGFVLRESNGVETIIYKTDLEDTSNAKVLREWGAKLPEAKNETAAKIDFSADSPVLVSKDMKNNPEIVVPLGNGELRQGHVLSKVEVKPGQVKTYVVEYADETGVINQVHLTQEQLLAANTPEALKKVKADAKRSAEYQAKSNTELQQILDEGHRAAKDAVGKGRTVDKMDLNAEPQTALSELARRNGVTSRAVFEAYRRGGVKGIEALAQAKDVARAPASIVSPAVTPVIVKPLSQLKTGDYVVTAGVGDKIKLPKPVGSETEGLVLGRDKVNNEIIYTVGVKKPDNSVVIQKMTDRELGDANSAFVGIKPERARSNDPQAIRAQIENDFANAKTEAQLAELRAKSRKKVEVKNSVTYADSNHPHLEGNADGVTTPEGAIYINTGLATDERFSTLLHEVSHTRTDRVNGDLTIESKSGTLSAQGYEKAFSLDEVKAATVNFAVDKQTVITQSKAARPGVPNRAVKREIENMQTSIDRRQAFINDTRESLDQIDDSLGSLVAKDVGRSGNTNFTIWQVTLDNVPGKTGSVKVNFSTPVNMSRSEAMGQLREFSRQERINMLNAQSRLDYDKAYLTELRAKVGVPKRPEPLKGGSLFADTRVNSRNPASAKIKAQAADGNPQLKDLVNDLDSVLAVRGRNYGLRDVNELTSGHPLTPVVEKQRQIMSRLNRIDRQMQPESFTRMASNVANDFAKSGQMDLAIPYYRATADTVYENLGSSAKSFWSNEANAKAAIRAGFVSDNNDVARMATEKLILAKAKSTDQNELKKVALDQYHNLGYEYDRILYGVKRYGNKNKEMDLLVIRKQQQYLSQKYKLKEDIESVAGKDSWAKMDEQADLTVEDILQNPKQIIDPDKFKKTQRVPASVPAAEARPSPSSRLPVEQKVEGRVAKSSPELEAQVDTYVESLKGADLSPKEVKSILHQQDLITATRNPVVAKVMDKAEVDFQGLKFGMLDSDVGKIAKFQENLLLKKTKESDELFDTIRGTAQTPAAKEVKSILADLGFAHPSLLNPNISNQEIRDIIAEVPVLRGYLHELPGMQLAIRDLNAGSITANQFRERFLANLGHNGPDDGFWGFLSGNIVPTSLANAKHPKAKVLFENSIFDHGEKLPSGVVKPKYPMPQTAAGIVHSTFDRLSQGTRGGVDKIFYELGGAPLAANPKAAIREIGVPPNKGLQLPNEMLIGNPEKTLRQLQVLQQHAATSKQLSKVQQTELSQFVGGAIYRLEKQNAYIKDHVELVRDEKGLVERMTLKFVDELGHEKKLVFTNDSPASEVAQGMEHMLLHEERLHGEPFKDFKLTPSKLASALANIKSRKVALNPY